MGKLKIAYLSYFNSDSVSHWSGSVFFIRKALEDAKVEVIPIDSLGSKLDNIYKYKSLYYKIIGKKYQRPRELSVVKRAAKIAEKKLASVNADFILSSGSLELSMLETHIPTAFWADATFNQLVDYYPDYTNLAKETVRNGEYLEKLSIGKAKYQFFASDWAAQSSIKHYGSNPESVFITPFGANLAEPPKYDDIKRLCEKKSFDVINILFVGVDWHRKGGDIAMEIANKINQSGRKAVLHIVGCTPPFQHVPDYVKVYGFLRKNIPSEYDLLLKLFSESHFFAMPSRHECFGIVFCEANAYGLPVIAANNGGMPTIVREGINGTMYEHSDGEIDRIAAFIERHCNSRQNYIDIALSSYNEFASRLNWQTSVAKVIDVIKQQI